MKLLFDFLPILLFFGTFKYAEGQPDWAAAFATEHFGRLFEGGTVGPKEAPVMLATIVVIVATLAQVAWVKFKGRKVEPMLWVSLVLVVVLGGLTLWFKSETFIKWKPTLLYWAMGGAVLLAQLIWNRSLLMMLLGQQMQLPEPVWRMQSWMWGGFFAFMGALNLWVAYHFSTDAWVNFKLFGGMGLVLAFSVLQGLILSKHLQDDAPAAQAGAAERQDS